MTDSEETFFTIEQIVAIMAICAHTWRDGVRDHHYPQPYRGKFNKHFWKKSDIELLINLIVDGVWTPKSVWEDLTSTQ
jgi:hypothetical protein